MRRSSSYYEHLVALNARFASEKKPCRRIDRGAESLKDEDLLEMLNAGLIKLVVIDSHKVDLWKQDFRSWSCTLISAFMTAARSRWAFRKDSPLLKEKLAAFMAKNGPKSGFANETLRRYLKSSRYVKNATADAELKKFKALVELFRKYGDRYDLDWLMMAAQGYQESRLDQEVRSPVGAIGVMQVMPATGKELKVGDIRDGRAQHPCRHEVHALHDGPYFKDEPMTDAEQALFTFAAYNAGPGRLGSLRREAASAASIRTSGSTTSSASRRRRSAARR